MAYTNPYATTKIDPTSSTGGGGNTINAESMTPNITKNSYNPFDMRSVWDESQNRWHQWWTQAENELKTNRSGTGGSSPYENAYQNFAKTGGAAGTPQWDATEYGKWLMSQLGADQVFNPWAQKSMLNRMKGAQMLQFIESATGSRSGQSGGRDLWTGENRGNKVSGNDLGQWFLGMLDPYTTPGNLDATSSGAMLTNMRDLMDRFERAQRGVDIFGNAFDVKMIPEQKMNGISPDLYASLKGMDPSMFQAMHHFLGNYAVGGIGGEFWNKGIGDIYSNWQGQGQALGSWVELLNNLYGTGGAPVYGSNPIHFGSERR